MTDPFACMALASSIARALEELDLQGPREKPATATATALTKGDPGVLGMKVIEHLDRMGYAIVPNRRNQ